LIVPKVDFTDVIFSIILLYYGLYSKSPAKRNRMNCKALKFKYLFALIYILK